MRNQEVKSAKVEELIRIYSEAARIHGQTTESGDYRKGNKAADLIAIIYSELRRRGYEAQCALLPLLKDKDRGIRHWAAGHALDFSPSHGEPVLRELATSGGFLGFNSKMALEVWQKGELKFPDK